MPGQNGLLICYLSTRLGPAYRQREQATGKSVSAYRDKKLAAGKSVMKLALVTAPADAGVKWTVSLLLWRAAMAKAQMERANRGKICDKAEDYRGGHGYGLR